MKCLKRKRSSIIVSGDCIHLICFQSCLVWILSLVRCYHRVFFCPNEKITTRCISFSPTHQAFNPLFLLLKSLPSLMSSYAHLTFTMMFQNLFPWFPFTFCFSFLWGDEDGPFSILYLNIWSHHAKPLLQDLINKINQQ